MEQVLCRFSGCGPVRCTNSKHDLDSPGIRCATRIITVGHRLVVLHGLVTRRDRGIRFDRLAGCLRGSPKVGIQDLLVPVRRDLSWLIARDSTVVAMAVVALTLVAIGPTLGFGTGLFSTESDAHYETRRRIAKRCAEREAPTGAILTPCREGR